MHARPHRNNTDFQLKYFIAGSCFTADAAWMLMYEQKLDMENRIVATKASMLRVEAKRLELEEKKKEELTQSNKLRLQADIMENENSSKNLVLSLEGAEKELETIISIMDELEPLRKYSHLSLLDASEASQRDEWKEEFSHRIENYLLTMGTIPEDQIAAMRKHPDFEKELVPRMKALINKVANASNSMDLLKNTPNLLLEHKKD